MKVTLTAPFLALLGSISVTIASPIYDTTIVNKASAPLLSSTSSAEHIIPNNYIVVFKKNVDGSAISEHQSWVADIHSAKVAELKKRSQIPLLQESGVAVDDVEALTGLKHTYNIEGHLAGYSGAFDESTVEAIRQHPDVSTRIPLLLLCRISAVACDELAGWTPQPPAT